MEESVAQLEQELHATAGWLQRVSECEACDQTRSSTDHVGATSASHSVAGCGHENAVGWTRWMARRPRGQTGSRQETLLFCGQPVDGQRGCGVCCSATLHGHDVPGEN